MVGQAHVVPHLHPWPPSMAMGHGPRRQTRQRLHDKGKKQHRPEVFHVGCHGWPVLLCTSALSEKTRHTRKKTKTVTQAVLFNKVTKDQEPAEEDQDCTAARVVQCKQAAQRCLGTSMAPILTSASREKDQELRQHHEQ